MAHDVYEMEDGRDSMAFIGLTPWHGLGQKVDPDQPIEVWMREAGLNWEAKIQKLYREGVVTRILRKLTGNYDEVDGRVAIARSDTNEVLSIVSDRYQVVQPREILEFYRNLISLNGFKMETAGSLQNGKRVWALADTGRSFDVAPRHSSIPTDPVKFYLMLATSYDGSYATTAQFTSIRVVCNNTLGFSLSRGDAGHEPCLRITHSSVFNADEIKQEMGLQDDTFDLFIENSRKMARTGISEEEAILYFLRIFKDIRDYESEHDIDLNRDRVMKRVLATYALTREQAPGTADGTVWGLVNTVTNYVDFVRGKTNSTRLNHSWFGEGRQTKEQAWNDALQLVA